MTLNEFINKFEEEIVMVEEGTVTLETVLDELVDWDSMARVALNATLDAEFGFVIPAEELKKIQTFKDIVNYIKGKLE